VGYLAGEYEYFFYLNVVSDSVKMCFVNVVVGDGNVIG
jgi:hypothetical protein